MSATGPISTEEDSVSIISFNDLEDDDYALPGSDIRIQRWLSQQCRFSLEDSATQEGEKEKELGLTAGPYGIGGPGELLSSVLTKHRESSSASEDEAALRADSPLLGFEEKTLLEDPLHFPSATYVRDLPLNKQPSHARSQSASSSPRRTLGLLPLSRRPSLLRKPSLPLLGELDDESSIQPQAISPPIIPQTGRSRAQSNASISSFHLPTSMQHSQPISTPPTLSPIPGRHLRTPPVSSTLASFSYGVHGDEPGARPMPSPIPRPHSHAHATHKPPPQRIPHTLSRSSSTLSLALLTSNRNAVYIDDEIDIDAADFVDDIVSEGHEGEGNQKDIPSHTNTASLTTTKKPTRPPPAPPLIMDEGGLGGVGVLDEDAITADEERDQFLEGVGGVYPHHHHHHHHHRQSCRQQHVGFEESDVIHHENDDIESHDSDADVNLHDEVDQEVEGAISRWSLTSSTNEIISPPSVASSGGGGLFASRKERIRLSFNGGSDKEKSIDEKDRKKGRLVSFISRISSIAPPSSSSSYSSQNNTTTANPKKRPFSMSSSNSHPTSISSSNSHPSDGFDVNQDLAAVPLTTLGFWFGDIVPPPPPAMPSPSTDVREKKAKDKNKEKGKNKVGEEFEEKVDRVREADDQEKENDEEDKPRVITIESIDVAPVSAPVMANGAIESADPTFESNPKAVLSQLRVDTSVRGSGHQQQQQQRVQVQHPHHSPYQHQHAPQSQPRPQFRQPIPTNNTPLTSSSSSSSRTYPSSTSSHSQSFLSLGSPTSSTKGLKHVASPIVKAFSDGFGDAGSALDFMGAKSSSSFFSSIAVGGSGGSMGMGMGMGMVRARSSSTADLLGRKPQHPQHQQRGQQGQIQGPSQGQGQSQTRRYASGHLHPPQPQPQQGQNRQQGYSSEAGGYQSHHQPQHHQQPQPHPQHQLRQFQELQSHSQLGEQQSQQQHQQHQYSQQPQTYSGITEYSYGGLGDLSSLKSPATAPAGGCATTIIRRPGLVKSVSTSMLNTASGSDGLGYSYGDHHYRNGGSSARRDADLPPTPISLPTTDDNEEEGEEEDYGVEMTHGRWRRDKETGYKKLETEHEEESWDALRRRQQSQQCLEEHSIITDSTTSTAASTAASSITTPITTPRVSIDTIPSPSLSATPSLSGGAKTRKGGSNPMTKTQEQMKSLVHAVDKTHKLATHSGNASAAAAGGVGLTPTPAIKNGNGSSSKGFRGFVERIKFTTATTSTTSHSPTSSSSSSSSSPIIPPPLVRPTNIISGISPTSLFTPAISTTASKSSLSSSHSPTTSGAVPDGSFLNDRFLGPDNHQKNKKQLKRKLIINGVSKDDVEGFEAVKAWCESFGEVKEMKRTPDGYLHVDFRKACVAETVCRLKTQVFIKGAGSVSLSWYTKESKGFLL